MHWNIFVKRIRKTDIYIKKYIQPHPLSHNIHFTKAYIFQSSKINSKKPKNLNLQEKYWVKFTTHLGHESCESLGQFRTQPSRNTNTDHVESRRSVKFTISSCTIGQPQKCKASKQIYRPQNLWARAEWGAVGQPWDWGPSSCWLAREPPKAWTIRGVPGASLLSVRLVGCSVRHRGAWRTDWAGLAGWPRGTELGEAWSQ